MNVKVTYTYTVKYGKVVGVEDGNYIVVFEDGTNDVVTPDMVEEIEESK